MPGGAFGGGGTGGGGLGGGLSGGPATASVADFIAGTAAEDQLIRDLMAQDVTGLAATMPGSAITASAVIANFDGGLGANGAAGLDLASLYSSSALDALSALYEQSMADQQAALEASNYSQMYSMEWAAWHSGPTSDILNFLNFQLQVIQFSFDQFLANRVQTMDSQPNGSHAQQESVAMAYLMYGANLALNSNACATFRQALDLVAQATIADPSNLVQFAKDSVSQIESVVISASRLGPENTYGVTTIPDVSYVTGDGQHVYGSEVFDDLTHLPSEFGAILNVLHQHGTSLNALAMAAHDMDFINWFKHLESGGDWDVKNMAQVQGQFANQMHSWFAAAGISQSTIADFGNFLFGVVAAARDYSLPYTLEGAGAYQVFDQGLGDHSAGAETEALLSTAAGGMLVGAENAIHDWLAATDLLASGDTNGLSNMTVPLANNVAQWLTTNGFTWGDSPDDSSQIAQGWLFYHG